MMKKGFLKNNFAGQEKPVVAMVHFPPNPGSPLYDKDGGIEKIYESVYNDAKALIKNGVKTVMFCNEGDRPYMDKVGFETPTTMAAVVSRVVSELNIETFGTDILYDPKAALALGKATGASFVREVFSGLFAGDSGFWDTNVGEVFRYKKFIDADDIVTIFNINGEFADLLDKRPLEIVAKSVHFSSLADIVCISGPMTGMATQVEDLKKVKEALAEDGVPVFANTGVTIDNVEEILSVADGVIIGSHLKVDGYTWNPVDPERVKRFMDKVNSL